MKKELLIVGVIFVLLAVGLSGCTNTNQTSDNKDKENGKELGQEYIWSEMTEGPYRDKVSFATSTDLLNWTDSGLILANHASVPGAVYKNNTIYVYFVDVSEDGKPEQIGLIRSTDNGSTWSSKEYVTFDGIGEKVPVDPAPFLLSDGRIRLYYFDINEQRISQNQEATNKIYSAISTDGINFVQEDGVRFERKGIFDPDAVEVNGTWRLYVGDIEGNEVISAVSSNGLSFTEEGTALDGGAVPDVFFKNDIYYLYTAGIDISTSQNGASFTKTLYSFRLQGKVTADPSVIELDDGTYIMLYKTQD
ncbi:MAG: hypothetical protein NTV74_05425 [Euryarchaeota archaeon]|nr:hypothetical protein [Euryarchaeota archaeon]